MDENILNELFPLPTQDELKTEIVQELNDSGFTITNFASGGVFNMLLMIFIRIKIELISLIRVVVPNIFIASASGDWVELKAADFSKVRKVALKTQGYITLSRTVGADALKIGVGEVFKTEPDIIGDELRYFVIEETILQKDALSQKVLVEAEFAGSKYNVPVDKIVKSLVALDVDVITNESDWLEREGADIEPLESLRTRTLNSWAELSTMPIRDKYKNVAESIEGVLFVTVDDLHPRGQGTIDIIVTSTAGAATETLLLAVGDAVDAIKGPYDNLLVKSSETVTQDIEIVIYIASDASDDGLVTIAETAVTDLFEISKDRELNTLYRDDLVFALKSAVGTSVYKKSNIIQPAADIELTTDKVLILGSMTITIDRV